MMSLQQQLKTANHEKEAIRSSTEVEYNFMIISSLQNTSASQIRNDSLPGRGSEARDPTSGVNDE